MMTICVPTALLIYWVWINMSFQTNDSKVMRILRNNGIPRSDYTKKCTHIVWAPLTPEALSRKQMLLEHYGVQGMRCLAISSTHILLYYCLSVNKISIIYQWFILCQEPNQDNEKTYISIYIVVFI